MAQIGVVADAVDPRCDGKRRVHQHRGRPDVAQPVRDGLGVECRHDRLRKQPGQKPRAGLRIFVEMQLAGGALA